MFNPVIKTLLVYTHPSCGLELYLCTSKRLSVCYIVLSF